MDSKYANLKGANKIHMRFKNITNSLLGWYGENKRDLPWRHTREPYAVWISEIMAQQTRIAFLLGYYERFMERFPTVKTLAEAPEDAVFKAWEGLGYYARARNLQKAAQKVMAEHDGRLPATREKLLALPGIGEYTAGAILSIAYSIPTPAVDGNVLRVYARLQNSDEDILNPQTKRKASDFVAALMPDERVSCFTQALMELGALVCIPRSPDCANCPVRAYCLAKASGRERELPRKPAKKPSPTFEKTVLVVRDERGQVLMRRRTEKMLSGLWEPLLCEPAMTRTEAVRFLQKLGLMVRGIKELGAAKHVFTHQIWRMCGYDCTVPVGPAPQGYLWLPKEELQALAIPTALRFYAKQI